MAFSILSNWWKDRTETISIRPNTEPEEKREPAILKATFPTKRLIGRDACAYVNSVSTDISRHGRKL